MVQGAGNRSKVILATKVIGRSQMDWFREPRQEGRLTKAQMTYALEQSLKRLQTDYIDLYQLHWPERPAPWGSNPTRFSAAGFKPAADETSIAEQLEILQGFVKAGKVRHIGLSNESAWGTMRFLFEAESKGLPRVVTVQNAYNLLNRTYDVAMAEIHLREQVGLMAYSPLGQGFLTGKYLNGARPRARAPRCSTAASATRRPARKRPSPTMSASPGSTGSIRPPWPWPSSPAAPSSPPTSSARPRWSSSRPASKARSPARSRRSSSASSTRCIS